MLSWLRRHIFSRENELPEKREFVYLDDVSVYSLLASTTGSITDTHSQRELERSEKRAKANAGIDSIASGGGEWANIDESSSEVVRKSIIQSKFKELYEAREDEIWLSRYTDNENVPITFGPANNKLSRSTDDVGELSINGPNDVRQVKRGDLIEIDIDLSGEKTYDYYLAFESILEIIQENKQQFGVDDIESLQEVETMIDLIDRLLVDSIPIVGESTDFCVLSIDEENFVIPKGLADTLSESVENASTHPLAIAGLIKSDLLWDDPRHILFDNTEYTIYCRVENADLLSRWRPFKLASVLESISPELAARLYQFPHVLESAMNDQDFVDASGSPNRNDQPSLADQIRKYGYSVEQDPNTDTDSIDTGDLEDTTEQFLSNMSVDSADGLGERREVLQAYRKHLEKLLNVDIRDVDHTEYRDSAYRLVRSENQDPFAFDQSDEDSEEDNRRYLEANIIGIYW